MPLISEMYSGRYLTAAELKGKPYSGTIEDVNVIELKDDNGETKPRVALTLSDLDKVFVLNQTNAFEISEVLGDDTDNWTGASITLGTHKVTVRGRAVDGIKVKSVHADGK